MQMPQSIITWLHVNYSANTQALIFTVDWPRHGDAFHSFQAPQRDERRHNAASSLNNFEPSSKQLWKTLVLTHDSPRGEIRESSYRLRARTPPHPTPEESAN